MERSIGDFSCVQDLWKIDGTAKRISETLPILDDRVKDIPNLEHWLLVLACADCIGFF